MVQDKVRMAQEQTQRRLLDNSLLFSGQSLSLSMYEITVSSRTRKIPPVLASICI